MQIFIRDPRKPLLVEPTKVLNGLRTVGQVGLKLYLEYLVIQRRSEVDISLYPIAQNMFNIEY